MTWNRHARASAWGVLAVLVGSVTLTARQAQPAATGIHGRVTSATDNAPVARARVLALADGSSDPHVAITDADGKYAIADLPSGAYIVSVSRTGFAPQTYGQGRQAASQPVTVTAGQSSAADFSLVAGLSLSGRILDEDGTPFAGAIVDALVPRRENGMETLVSMASGETNDRGEFRLFGLAPGQYYLTAADPAFRSVATAKGVLRYSPTYYPGVSFADQARAIVIGDGSTPPAIEFRLKIVPPASVSGRLVPDDGKPLLNGAIILSASEGEGVPLVAAGDPTLRPDGRFTFPHVPPGRYQIRARAQTTPTGAALFGVFSIELAGTDVDGIVMTLRPGAVIDGRVKIEARAGTRAPGLTSLRVRAPLTDGTSFGDALTGTVQPDGSFALRGVMKGPHQLVVDGLKDPWVIRRVDYRGADVSDREMDVNEREQLHGVTITITDVSNAVSGTVHDARKRPVADAGVLVFPKVPIFWTRTNRRMRFTATDRAGRFTIPGLPAGDYIAVASTWVDESDLGRRDRLRALQEVGVPFTLDGEGTQAQVTLTVAAPPAGPGVGGR
jgi:hypothetical protein